MNLKSYLAEIGMNIKDFSALIGCNNCYLSRVIHGHTKAGYALANTIKKMTNGQVILPCGKKKLANKKQIYSKNDKNGD